VASRSTRSSFSTFLRRTAQAAVIGFAARGAQVKSTP
jgi:hypothetical protein